MKSFGPFTGIGGATQASKMVRVLSVLTESLLNTRSYKLACCVVVWINSSPFLLWLLQLFTQGPVSYAGGGILKDVKNKAVLCKPLTMTKATYCKPHMQSKLLQTGEHLLLCDSKTAQTFSGKDGGLCASVFANLPQMRQVRRAQERSTYLFQSLFPFTSQFPWTSMLRPRPLLLQYLYQ